MNNPDPLFYFEQTRRARKCLDGFCAVLGFLAAAFLCIVAGLAVIP